MLLKKFELIDKELISILQKNNIQTFKQLLTINNDLLNTLSIPLGIERGEGEGEREREREGEELNKSNINERIKFLKLKILELLLIPSKRVDSLFLYESGKVITTGSNEIDKLLYEGFHTGEITEIFGKTSSGKTQLCFSTAIHFVTRNEGTVLYIDTHNSFSSKRLKVMYKSLQKNINWMKLEEGKRLSLPLSLNRIRCIALFDFFELLKVLDGVKASIEKNLSFFYSKLTIIVIDSVASLLTPINGGKLKNNSNHYYQQILVNKMRIIAKKFDIAFIITNFCGFNLQPALGYKWNTLQSISLYLGITMNKGKMFRTATLRKGISSSEYNTCQFEICDEGICDITPLINDDSQEEDDEMAVD